MEIKESLQGTPNVESHHDIFEHAACIAFVFLIELQFDSIVSRSPRLTCRKLRSG